MEKWQLSIYWPDVISVVRGHTHTSVAACVCVCSNARTVLRACAFEIRPNFYDKQPPIKDAAHLSVIALHCLLTEESTMLYIN